MNELSRAEEILRKREKDGGPKYEQLERFDAKITGDQFDYLKKISRQTMRTRTGEKIERITANSILRTAIEILRELDPDLLNQDISTERELLKIARRKLYEQGKK